MQIVRSVTKMREIRKRCKGSVGFVPTMGALHQGHLSLIQKSKEESDITILSIFVNPMQFLEGEDYASYPRKIEADSDICRRAGVDILFLPEIEDMYKKDEVEIKAPKIAGYKLEGAVRPGHFDGVLRVVMKLFNIIKPTNAYFGKKDAQQLLLVEKMVREYFLDVNIKRCDTVREDSGLALSSRNLYLDSKQKERALILSKALKKGMKLIMEGEKSAKIIKERIRDELNGVECDYVEIVNFELQEIEEIQKESIILAAIRVDGVRLIDNLWM